MKDWQIWQDDNKENLLSKNKKEKSPATYESVFFVNFVRSTNFFFLEKKKEKENFKAEITAVCSFFYKEEAGRENLIELLPLIKFSHNPEKDSIISDHAYFIYKEAI